MREVINLNKQWRFVEKNVSLEEASKLEGEVINIPHTWNNQDGQDGGGDYVRSKYWYFRKFEAPRLKEGQKLWLEFNAVNSSATVYINGDLLGVHHGGYSRFRFEITDYYKDGENEIEVNVDNEPNETVYPQTADFTFYGGIYRDVNLIVTESIHFEMDASGSKGIKIDSELFGDDATVRVHGWRSLPEDTRVEIFDAEGNLIAQGKGNEGIKIENVHRWNGRKDPYLYKIVASAYHKDIKVDELTEYYGFREFFIDPRKGFILNGVSYPLRGVARHQDRLGVGNAITNENIEQDMDLIAEVGANTIRLAHYQHSDYTYELADRYGFLIWSEIPYISRHMPGANENAESQMRELIAQTYNRCSIFVRGISNEITMKPSTGKTKVHKHLNEMIHGLDPTRPTCMANFAMMFSFNPFCHIADATAMNFYHGWYTPWTWLNGVRLSFFHFFFPGKPLGFSEYGAEGMPNLHTEHPKRGDNSEEYQLICHYKIYKALEKRKYLWATHLWNMFDFAADARNVGGDPGKNHKGLVTFDRGIKKDSFYLYKAFWSDEPFVHICGKRFVDRHESKANIYVVSNQPEVTLMVNGKEFGKLGGNQRLYHFIVPVEGDFKVEAVAGECHDEASFRKVSEPNPEYVLHVKSNNASWEKKKK